MENKKKEMEKEFKILTISKEKKCCQCTAHPTTIGKHFKYIILVTIDRFYKGKKNYEL